MYHPIQEAGQLVIDAVNFGLSAMYMPNSKKNNVESEWSVTDREGIVITMAMGNAPQAVEM